MDQYGVAPQNIIEVIFSSAWPMVWLYGLLLLAGVLGLSCCRVSKGAGWIVYLPAIWLFWQVIASADTIDKAITWPTLKHLAACAVCFYLGYFALGAAPRANVLWTCLGVAMVPVISTAWSQHFGGLQDSRDYFMTYVYPTMPHVPPEYLKKLNSTRVFGTLFYPNALAGVLILIMPVTLTVLWHSGRATREAKTFMAGCLIVGACGAFYWSGSKGGWLIVLGLVILAFLRWPVRPITAISKRGWIIMALLICVGLGGFFWKYSGFFQRGATSVVARFDYWRAAGEITARNPWSGTGPGTFAKSYARVKKPESEMARLAHNDYLQQASDSGVPGALFYAGFWLGTLLCTAARMPARASWVCYAVWLGLLGWACQGVMEFGLYLPALGWTSFAMAGWLLAYTAAVPNAPGSPAQMLRRRAES